MRKFLMCLVVTLITTMGFAANVDTLYFKPGDVGKTELKVDYEKYPYLKDVTVAWYVGFPETLEYIARDVIEDEILDFDGKQYLYNKKIGDSWDANYPDVRTLELFYGHKITKAGSDIDLMHKKDYFDGIICDTIVVLHLLKEMDVTNFDKVNVEGGSNHKKTVNIGDTVRFKVLTKGLMDLDVKTYSLITVDETDTTVIATSTTPDIYFVAEESVKVKAMMTNDIGSVVFETEKTINVLPDFKVMSLTSTVVTGKDVVTKTLDNVETMTLSVLNHDSLSLTITTNHVEAGLKDKMKTSWNKDGVGLPEGVKIEQDTILTFKEYLKPDMDGKYNCILSNDKNEVIANISFIIESQFPTSNEGVDVNTEHMRVLNNVLYLTDVNGAVRVFNMNGGLVRSFRNSGTSQITLNLPAGIYVITDGTNKIKAKIN